MTTAPPARSRGMATILVVAILGVVAIALATMTVRINHDGRHAKTIGIDAQLRHLLLAGGAAAPHAITNADTGEPRPIPLPPSLADSGYSLHVQIEPTPPSPDRRIVTIHATHPTTRAQQRVVLQRKDERWTVVEASLQRSR